MKKFILIFAFFYFAGLSLIFADNCQESSSEMGNDDDPVVVTISSFPCVSGGTITDLTMDATIGETCPEGYAYDVYINGSGTPIATDLCDEFGYDLTSYLPITSVTLESKDTDEFSEEIELSLTLYFTYTPGGGTCSDPTDQTATPTVNSAQLGWTDEGEPESWFIEWGSQGFTQGTGTTIEVFTNPYNLSGLSANSSYDWYVKAICGEEDESEWAGPSSFTTLCAAIDTFPSTEDFENGGSIPNCWIDDPTNTESWLYGFSTQYGATYDHTSGSGYFAWIDDSSPHDATPSNLLSPIYNTTSLTNPRLVFYYWIGAGQSGSTLYVDVYDGSTWQTSLLSLSAQNGWLQASLDLTSYSDTNIQIRFSAYEHLSAFTCDICIDDVTIEETPSCLEPSAQTETAISNSAADLGWTDNASATTWFIEWDTMGFTPGTGTMVNTSSNPHNLSGLSADTSYDWYVRAYCGVGDTSIWFGPSTFTTLCNAITTFPYTEGFENAGSMPDCWRQEFTSGTYNWEFTTGVNGSYPATAHGGTYNAAFVSPTTGNATKLVSPILDLSGLTTPRLKFWRVHTKLSTYQDTLKVYYKTSAGGSWSLIPGATYNNDQTSWIEVKLTLPNPGSTYFIAFEGIDGNAAGIGVDDITVEETPSCEAPTAQTETGITSSSASLGWTDNAGASSWIIEWGTQGFTQGTGTTVQTSSNPHNLSVLTADTPYDWYVRAYCGVGDSSFWVGPSSFSTPCDAISLFPAKEDFENGGSIPDCWVDDPANSESWLYGTTVTPPPPYGATYDHTTGSGYFAWIDDSSPYDARPSNLLSPIYNTSALTTPRLTFYYWIGGITPSFSTLDIDVFDGSTWQTDVLSLSYQYGWAQATLDLTSYSNANLQIRFSGMEQLFIHDCDICIDDITVEETPSCIAPTADSTTNITDISAKLWWTENDTASKWDIIWDTAGFNPYLQGTIVSGIVNEDTILSPPFTENTAYDWYVRAYCGLGDSSTWAGPVTFTTLCEAITTFPAAEDFENLGSIPDCWTDDPANTESWRYSTIADNGATSDHTSGSGYFAWIDDSSPNNATPSNLLSPAYNTTTLVSPRLVFYYWIGRGAAGSTINVDVYDGSTWQTALLTLGTQYGWLDTTLDLSAYSNANLQIRFSAYEQSPGIDCDICIDDVTVEETPTCEAPTVLSESNITGSSADLSWTDNAGASTWIIEST